MKKYLPLLALLLPCSVMAADKVSHSEWAGEGELGYTATSGNTDSETLKAKLSVEKSHNRWTHKAGLDLLKASTDGVDSADAVIVTEKTEYKLSEKAYAFGALRYEDDKFSGYDYQASASVGVGRKFFKDDRKELDASLGVGVKSAKESATGETSDNGIIRGDLIYKRKLSQHAKFLEKILIETGSANTYSESETALQMKINGNLSAKISYNIKHNSDVSPGVENTDRMTSVTLVYSF